MAKVKAAHHRGAHQVTARRITQAAYANPETRCWRCSRTLAEVRLVKPKAIWTAGHDDHNPNVYRGAECSPCNFGAGATLRNQRAKAKRTGTAVTGVSRPW